jgi:hypothetical protein
MSEAIWRNINLTSSRRNAPLRGQIREKTVVAGIPKSEYPQAKREYPIATAIKIGTGKRKTNGLGE